ncbi:MAG: TolC family protein [Bacillota bacterium]
MKIIKKKNLLIKTTFITILILSFSFIIPKIVLSEEIEELSLKEAIEVAYENNSELKQAKISKEKSDLDIDLAWRSLFPTVDLESSYTKMSEAPEQTVKYGLIDANNQMLPEDIKNLGEDTIEFPGTDQEVPENIYDEYLMLPTGSMKGPDENYKTSISITQPLYMGGKISLGIEQAKKGQKMTELQNEQKNSEILIEIINSYYNLLMARERVDIEKDALELVEEHKKLAESSYESGVGLKTDVLQAEIELSDSKNSLLNAKKEYNLAKKSFRNQIGLENSNFEITNSQIKPDISLNKEKLYNTALNNKIELEILELNEELTKSQLKLENRSNFPQLMLIGNYSWQGEELNFENGSGNIILSASMSIFDGGKSAIKEDKIEKDIKSIEESKKSLKDGMELEIEQQLINIEKQENKLDLQELNLNKAKQSLNLEEKRFEEGMSNSVNVLQIQNKVKQIELAKMQAENQYKIALFEMMAKTGQLVDYIEGVINNEK